MAVAQRRRRSGTAAKRSRTGRAVAAVTVSANAPSRGRSVPISSAAERPSVRQRDPPEAARCARALRPAGRCARSISPGAATFAWSPVHEIDDRHPPLAAVARPDRADALQRGGQRDHRAGRQRHADVAADGGRVPDLERGQERAAALADQRRARSTRPAARTRIELGDRCRSRRSPARRSSTAAPASRASQGRSAGADAAAARRTARCRRPARHRRPASAATGRRRAAGPPL